MVSGRFGEEAMGHLGEDKERPQLGPQGMGSWALGGDRERLQFGPLEAGNLAVILFDAFSLNS